MRKMLCYFGFHGYVGAGKIPYIYKCKYCGKEDFLYP